MNTPAHLVVNLALLGRAGARGGRRFDAWIAAGSVAPDLPMFGFYFWEKMVSGSSEARIWNESYFAPGWQDFFDAFNSLPLAAVAGLAAWRFGRPAVAWFFASAALHCAIDLLLHRQDAHRHFLPLSDWRFESPISYWDPAHHGAIGAGLEAAAVLACSVVLWRRTQHRLARGALLAVSALYLAGYTALYLINR